MNSPKLETFGSAGLFTVDALSSTTFNIYDDHLRASDVVTAARQHVEIPGGTISSRGQLGERFKLIMF